MIKKENSGNEEARVQKSLDSLYGVNTRYRQNRNYVTRFEYEIIVTFLNSYIRKKKNTIRK